MKPKKGAKDWGYKRELSFNSNDYDCAHPTLSADGQKLYFTSNMPGGFGGMDLYVVEKMEDGWGKPMNLGKEINTDKNELFPFIHSSGNLIFSSNGYQGAGGLDLYMIHIGGRKWGNVTNLGYPFNSSSDDLGLILNPEGTRGYFASSRKGGTGKDDIYMFEAPDGIWGRTTPSLFTTTLKIYDSNSKNAIDGAEIRVFEKTAEGFVSDENDLFEGVLMPAEGKPDELVFKLVRKDEGALNTPDLYSDNKGKAKYDFLGERRYLLLVSKEGYATKEMIHSTIGNDSKSEISITLEKSFCSNLIGIVKDDSNDGFIPNAVVRVRSSCERQR